MRPDPSQAVLDDRIAAATVEQRVAWSVRKRAVGLRLVWQQVDDAGIEDPVEQAAFLLRGLYPDMPAVWLDRTVARLAALHADGRWSGYERP